MTPIMVEIVAFLVFATSAWYFLYRVVPKLGRWATLCLLHNRRDQLYDLIEDSHVQEESLVYQDILFGLTLLIRLVRDEPRRRTLPILARILGIRPWSEPVVEDELDWRLRRYDREREELFSGEAGQADLRTALDIYREKDLALFLYTVTSHPIFFILTLLFTIFGALIAPGVYYYRLWKRIDIKSIGKTLDSIRIYQNSDSMGHSYV